MKTLIVALMALTASAQAAEYKPGSLQEIVNIRQMEEKMNPSMYFFWHFTQGKKLEEVSLSKRKAQVYLWYVCKDFAELRSRIGLVDSSSDPQLRIAADALNAMRCEINPDKLEFTNMRDLIELDRLFRTAYDAIQRFHRQELDSSNSAAVNRSRTLKVAPRSQVGEETRTSLDAR